MATIDILRDLDTKLHKRREITDLFEDYYAGKHRLAYATEKYRDAFGELFGAFADNWCGVIADTPVERLSIEGIKADGEVSESAWNLWHDNDMELHSKTAMLGAVKCGHSYVLVDVTGDAPTFHVWPSSMAIVQRDPKTRKPISGMTTWLEADGHVGAELYLPDEITRYRSAEEAKQGTDPSKRVWAVVDTIDNPYDDGSIPLVEVTNRPNELGIGRSDLADVLALQDGINKLANDMIIASEFQAFRQRVLTGIEIPKDPVSGLPLASQQVEAAMSRLWAFEPADAKVYDLEPTNLANYVSGIRELLTHLAAQTRTPPHYLLGEMVNVSGDALAAAESGLVSRVEAKQTAFTIAFREVLRLARVTGKVEIVWRNPERQSLAARADAVLKLSDGRIGLARRELWKLLGYSPLEIAKMEDDPAAKATAIDGTASTTSTAPTTPPPLA